MVGNLIADLLRELVGIDAGEYVHVVLESQLLEVLVDLVGKQLPCLENDVVHFSFQRLIRLLGCFLVKLPPNLLGVCVELSSVVDLHLEVQLLYLLVEFLHQSRVLPEDLLVLIFHCLQERVVVQMDLPQHTLLHFLAAKRTDRFLRELGVVLQVRVVRL